MTADLVQDGDDVVHLLLGEQHVRALRCEVGERRLVEPGDLHDAVGGEVFDDELDEPQLVRGERRIGQVAVERRGRCLPVQPDQGADEQPEAV